MRAASIGGFAGRPRARGVPRSIRRGWLVLGSHSSWPRSSWRRLRRPMRGRRRAVRPDLVTPIQCPLSHHPPPFSRRAHPGRFAFRRPRILLAWHSLAAAGGAAAGGAIHDAEGSYDTALLACAVTCAVGSVSSVAVCRDPAGAPPLTGRSSRGGARLRRGATREGPRPTGAPRRRNRRQSRRANLIVPGVTGCQAQGLKARKDQSVSAQFKIILDELVGVNFKIGNS